MATEGKIVCEELPDGRVQITLPTWDHWRALVDCFEVGYSGPLRGSQYERYELEDEAQEFHDAAWLQLGV